jgi:hypothetical protein
MLAVTRLPPGPVCHVACIDGQTNRNANELARHAADEFARDFKCGKDEVKVVGENGCEPCEALTKRLPACFRRIKVKASSLSASTLSNHDI